MEAGSEPSLARFDLQRRLEASAYGQLLISAAIIATLLCVLVTNLPGSKVREDLAEVADPFLNATGLDQYWGVFAPEPRQQSLMFEARITYADGSTQTWSPPKGPALIGTFWDYRWEKVTEALPYEGDVEHIHKATAEWVAREQADSRRRPVEVVLVSGTYQLPPPREGAAEPREFQEMPFYTYVTPQGKVPDCVENPASAGCPEVR